MVKNNNMIISAINLGGSLGYRWARLLSAMSRIMVSANELVEVDLSGHGLDYLHTTIVNNKSISHRSS